MMEQHAEVISMAEQRAARDARDSGATRDGVSDRPRCQASTAADRPCRNYATDGPLCRVHAVQQGERPTPSDASPPDEGPVEHARRQGRDDAAAPVGGGSGDPAGAGSRAGSGDDGSSDATAGDAYERIAEEVRRRGWRMAIDGLAALDAVDSDALAEELSTLAGFLRRRLTGDYDIDDFGFDEDLTTNLLMPLVRPLHRHYWRVASHGVEHLPADGGGLVVANHAGTLPLDAIITRLDIFDQTGRHARELGADLVFRTPFIGEWARKTGATLASGNDADRLLTAGELVAVWPEGFKGLGKPWKDRYKLQRFGRGGFVATALRAQVPIVPTAIVGSEEIYPMIYDLRLLARALGVPYFPIVAQMFAVPVFGPLALLPLPSKWVIEYGEPIDTTAFGPEAADDPMTVFDLTDRVRDTIQNMLHRNLMGRRSVFL